MNLLKALYERISGGVPAFTAVAHTRSSLGELLVDMGRLSPAQLTDVVISQSAATDALIATEIQRLHLVTPMDIAKAYEIQMLIRTGHEDKARLAITQMKLDEAKSCQAEFGKKCRETIPLLVAAVSAGSTA